MMYRKRPFGFSTRATCCHKRQHWTQRPRFKVGFVKAYLINIFLRVSSYHVRRIPQTATNHSVEGAFVNGDVNTVAGNIGHVSDVLFEPSNGGMLD